MSLIVKEPDGEFRPENEWTRHSHQRPGAVNGNRSSKTVGTSAGFAGYSDGSVEKDLPMEQLGDKNGRFFLLSLLFQIFLYYPLLLLDFPSTHHTFLNGFSFCSRTLQCESLHCESS